jgi:hypothetical protein
MRYENALALRPGHFLCNAGFQSASGNALRLRTESPRYFQPNACLMRA